MMDLAQTKLVGLTMELDLKTREFYMLCDKLDLVKKGNIDPNDEKLLWLKDLFLENQDEIVKINKKLEILKLQEG